ncbi:hypothetical protein DY000_02038544 [Brassica cretica]|uniref:Reverse transcriptase zinc-binding domain-containing protein n=1 Tax=Brassica cretica TaxID=69181 RepID=A0ABQ7BIK3_BRACR|nr:hypothetical protein DY000_02038544 [Brassica cretica]
MIKTRSQIHPLLRRRLGNGETTSFWVDNWSPFGNLQDFLGASTSRFGIPMRNRNLRRLTLLAFQGTIYLIWHERNSRLHNQTFKTTDVIISTIDKQLRNRIQSFRHSNTRASSAMSQLWFLRS